MLSGKQVSHSGGELINSGTIAGRELIQLDSQNVKNRGTISAGILSGDVKGDLDNLGGTLEADRAILLNVSGNLTHGSTLHTTEVNNNGYQRSDTTIGRKGLIHVKGENGTLQLQSGGNFTVSGADIINDGQGQTHLSANGTLALNALNTGFDEKMGSGDHYRNQAIQDIEVSRIAGNGEVVVRANNIYSEGADLDAKAHLALIAENDIELGTATRQTAYEEYHKTKSGSVVAKKTETRHANSESKTQIGTVLSADNIVLSAGHDVTVTASQVVADNDVVIAAGNDVSITAGTNHFKDIYKETKKTSGAFTSGGGITFGSKSEKHEFETEGWTQSDARSVVGSLSGNVSIVAGNHAHVVGTDLVAPQEKTIAITGKTLKVEAGQDIIESNEKHEFKQSGLTVGVSSSLVDTAMAVSNGVKQAKQSKNDKLSALYAMKSAQDLIHSSETVSNTIDTVGNLVNGSITPAADDNAAVNSEPSIKVSVSVGASKSQSSSRTREVTHSASELNAGNIKLTTTAGNLDVIGSHLNADKITLSSAKDINLESNQDSYQNRSENSNSGWSVGVFLGMSGNSMGLGVEGSAQFGKGKSNTDTITQSNTYLNAKEVNIESQNDTNLKGAVVNADTLNAEIGGNLTIESRQDTNQYHSEQTQAGVSASVAIYGSGSSASASFSQNKAKANSAQVEEQSGFNVGNGGMNVTVVGNTHLKGGRIASEAEAENNSFRTGTLTTENIHNHSEMEIKNTSAGVSTNMAQMGMQAVGTALSALGNVDKNTSSTTHSAIGNNVQLEVKEGNIPIAEPIPNSV